MNIFESIVVLAIQEHVIFNPVHHFANVSMHFNSHTCLKLFEAVREPKGFIAKVLPEDFKIKPKPKFKIVGRNKMDKMIREKTKLNNEFKQQKLKEVKYEND